MKGILRNNTGDISIFNGKMEIGDNIQDVVECVMMSASGELKHAPKIGANLAKSINGTPPAFFAQAVKKMLKVEHVNATVKYDSGNITVEI